MQYTQDSKETPAASPPTGAAPTRLRRWIIGLGWLGLGLWLADELSEQVPFETTDYALLKAFNLTRDVLLYLWPAALWLQFSRLLPPWLELGAFGFAVLGTLVWVVLTLGRLLGEDAPWSDERVLYERPDDPRARVAVQASGNYSTAPLRYRVVRLTPVPGPWQRVEPVDTARFDARGWQRVKR
ncbi:hypothetical protein LJ737_08485 [Hymenobacter sp. 15J16-1T3B]|uniref:hypothetical protein n=1 Tax=Hymenobacter sp. 15J16-1T3B TaxID=2886941 RepID=UPI001D1204A5|nr:hypothetical protein [Hymenobacter sp. 15J16-1T3B]MCC3157273.1 hypothetical protein [Hymenobacter sp. 15J16-1T3B]